MTWTTGRVSKWAGRLTLVAGLIVTAVVFVRWSFTVERLTQRSAVGTVVGFGEVTRSIKNKTFQVPTVLIEYTTAGGSVRTTECGNAAKFALGDTATVWYSPYSARTGNLTPESNSSLPPDVIDGLAVALMLFATLCAWRLVPFLVCLPGELVGIGRDAREMRKIIRDVKAKRSEY